MVPAPKRNEAEKWILEKLKGLAPNKYNDVLEVIKGVTEHYGIKRVEETTGNKIKEDNFALIRKKNKIWKRGNIGMKEKNWNLTYNWGKIENLWEITQIFGESFKKC